MSSLAVNYAFLSIASGLFRARGPVRINIFDCASRFVDIKVNKHRKSFFGAGRGFHFVLIFVSKLSLNCFSNFISFFRHIFETFKFSGIHGSDKRNKEGEKMSILVQLFLRNRENGKPAKGRDAEAGGNSKGTDA